MILIDAHGPDHGLSVEVDITYTHEVTIREWGECSEPDENGSYSPHVRSAVIPLRALLDDTKPHWTCGHVPTESSMHTKIVNLAINWLCYWGGDEEFVDDEDRPCDHFGMNYSGIGARHKGPWPAHMKCDTCGGEPE